MLVYPTNISEKNRQSHNKISINTFYFCPATSKNIKLCQIVWSNRSNKRL